MIYVSGITAVKEDVEPIELQSEYEQAVRPTRLSQRQVLVPSGSGFTVASADDQARGRSENSDANWNADDDQDEDEAENERAPPYDAPEPSNWDSRQMQNERPLQVLHPGDAKKQAVVAMNRCIEAVQMLRGRREDIVKVKTVITVSLFQLPPPIYPFFNVGA